MAQGLVKDDVLKYFKYDQGKLFWKLPRGRKVKAGDRAGSVNSIGYRVIGLNGVRYLEHRIIFLMFNGMEPDYIDHINHDRSDNRIENLRECSRSQNNFNSIKPKNNTSGCKGVDWEKRRSRWLARIESKGKQIFIGRYKNIKDAIRATHKARAKYHGDFAFNG